MTDDHASQLLTDIEQLTETVADVHIALLSISNLLEKLCAALLNSNIQTPNLPYLHGDQKQETPSEPTE